MSYCEIIPKVNTVTNIVRPELENPALADKGHFNSSVYKTPLTSLAGFSVCQQLILLYNICYFIAGVYDIIYCFFNLSFSFDFISMTSTEAAGSTFRKVI